MISLFPLMSVETSLSQILQVIIKGPIATAGVPCICTCTLYVCNTLLHYPPRKSGGPARLPRDPTDLRAAGAGLMEVSSEQALYKPARALLQKVLELLFTVMEISGSIFLRVDYGSVVFNKIKIIRID